MKPLVPFLEIPADGKPYLRGLRCTHCKAVFFDRRRHCASCGTRDGLIAERMSERGRLVTFSIIHRSFPEVTVPYISSVVDLEGGGTLKGTLRGIAPDPAALHPGIPVEVAFDLAPEADAEGHRYLAYHFVPRGST